VPLSAAGSDGEEEDEEDAEDGEEGVVELLAAGLDDTEDFAPRALNLREESPVLRSLTIVNSEISVCCLKPVSSREAKLFVLTFDVFKLFSGGFIDP
jgi:hypothetical protein